METEQQEITAADDPTELDQWERVYYNEPACRERELWAAILQRAIDDVRGQRLLPKHKKRCQRDAVQWVKSQSRRLMAFESICIELGIDPDAIRRRILGERT